MRKYLISLSLLILFAGVISIQSLFDRESSQKKYVEPIVPKAEIVRAADLGLHNTASDLIWLATIQYFGGSDSLEMPRLPDYLNLSTDLDPKFSYPYAFGALVLPAFGKVDAGVALAHKGIEAGAKDWRIPYYLATTYFINLDDRANAAKYFDIAANTEGAPSNIQNIASNFGSKKDKRAQTKQIWTGIYESTKDEVVKERSKKYIDHFELMDFLDQAIEQYYKVHNKYPVEMEDLVSGRILRFIPEDPFGHTFKIDSEKHVVDIK